MQVVGYILCVLAIIWISFIFFLRESIAMAIGLLREAAAAIIALPTLILLPIFQTLIIAIFTALWLYFCANLISCADITTVYDNVTGGSYKEFNWSTESQRRIIFLLFCWLWTSGTV